MTNPPNPEPAAAPSHPSRVPFILCHQGRSYRDRDGMRMGMRWESTARDSVNNCRYWSSGGTRKGPNCSKMHIQEQQHFYFTAGWPKEFLCWGWWKHNTDGEISSWCFSSQHKQTKRSHSDSAPAPEIRGLCCWFFSQSGRIGAFFGVRKSLCDWELIPLASKWLLWNC